jgi:hypothetical protein
MDDHNEILPCDVVRIACLILRYLRGYHTSCESIARTSVGTRLVSMKEMWSRLCSDLYLVRLRCERLNRATRTCAPIACAKGFSQTQYRPRFRIQCHAEMGAKAPRTLSKRDVLFAGTRQQYRRCQGDLRSYSDFLLNSESRIHRLVIVWAILYGASRASCAARRAVQMAVGLLGVGLLYQISVIQGLDTLQFVMRNTRFVSLFAILVSSRRRYVQH